MSLEIPTEEWKKPRADFHLDPKKAGVGNLREQVVRDSAIQGADLEELEGAVDRMEKTLQEKPRDADTLTALARVRARLDGLIQKGQN